MKKITYKFMMSYARLQLQWNDMSLEPIKNCEIILLLSFKSFHNMFNLKQFIIIATNSEVKNMNYSGISLNINKETLQKKNKPTNLI